MDGFCYNKYCTAWYDCTLLEEKVVNCECYWRAPDINSQSHMSNPDRHVHPLWGLYTYYRIINRKCYAQILAVNLVG